MEKMPFVKFLSEENRRGGGRKRIKSGLPPLPEEKGRVRE